MTHSAQRSLRCLQPTGGCAWSHHNFKHFGARGVAREHTAHGPAKYAPSLHAAEIRSLETGTVCQPDRRAGEASAGRTRYLRDTASLIGWEAGVDATWSFVECSGGVAAGRSYHGRPVHAASPVVVELSRGIPE